MIHLRGVIALLGRFPALAGVDLDVGPGEIVLLQGPNGAGKTTLLRLCGGLLAPSGGTASVLGVDLTGKRRQVRSRVGMVGHASGLYGDLTVAENVRFWARACGAGAQDVPAALDRMGVAHRLHDVPVARLSAGQRRRTSLAAVVVRRPELWLLDEPHAGLDQVGRDLVDTLITDAAGAGATVLVASHELDRIRPLNPRVVTLAGGVVHDDVAKRDPEVRGVQGSRAEDPAQAESAHGVRDPGVTGGMGAEDPTQAESAPGVRDPEAPKGKRDA